MHQRHAQVLETISREPYDGCADSIRRVAPAVLSALTQRLRKEAPGLGAAPQGFLQDALPQVLDELAAVMQKGRASADDLMRQAAAHAHHRHAQDIDLDETLAEYQQLREILPGLLVADLGRDLLPEEAARLHTAIDLSVRRSAAEFVEQQKHKLQAEATAMAKYLSFLSHDLRGNLNGAMLMIEVLRRDLQNDPRFTESLQDLDAMRQSMLDLVGTMDRFLQAERLRQGRVEVSLQSVDVAKFLHEQRRGMGRQVRGMDEQIEVVVEAGLRVVTDREMLSLIVQNTLSNCVKYSSGGMVGLRAFRPAPGQCARPEIVCRIEVSDTGPGMEPELQHRLFEPFSRGTSTGRPGTGLGLFIAKQAADLIGADLTVDSERGVGTLFLIDLPNRYFSSASESEEEHEAA